MIDRSAAPGSRDRSPARPCGRHACARARSGITPPDLDSDGWLRVTIPIESIGHATGQMLSLGTDGEVLAPPELRARVRDIARAVAARYRPRAAPVRRSPRPRKLA